ncbi:unnamed protein product [Trichogramma brassicae]|uniref:Alpha-amylase n=1 Tax=Trichogramma brassicae TaxID=86971 RepID=A0A6H5HYK0_9HYME|nr:unnamed protein product [Trichogramma brassicae]
MCKIQSIIGVQIAVLVLLQLNSVQCYDSQAYKNPHFEGNRTTIVHLFEWKWKDIATECERFLGPMGFGGVQVSPITENIIIAGRPWYERYQPISYRFVTRSGNEDDLRDMVARCNKVGVRIYVDAVINHMTADAPGKCIGTDGSTAQPEKREFPAVPYTADDYNWPVCDSDDSTLHKARDCELVGLHDLNQRKENVRNKIVEFLNHAIDTGVAGFRVDAAKHMWPEDLEVIYERMNDLEPSVFGYGKRPFIYQEVASGPSSASNKWQYAYLGKVYEYTNKYHLEEFFRGSKPLSGLRFWGLPTFGLMHSNDAFVFTESHDSQRDANAQTTHKNPRLHKMAVAFLLAHPYGQTRVMSSFEFNNFNQGPPCNSKGEIISPKPIVTNVTDGKDVNMCENGWVCEHRWRQIYQMIGFRNVVGEAPFLNWWTNNHNQIAFSRGELGFVAFNGEFGVDLNVYIYTGMPTGRYCDVISGRKSGYRCTGKTIYVDHNRMANIKIFKDEQDGILAIHKEVMHYLLRYCFT